MKQSHKYNRPFGAECYAPCYHTTDTSRCSVAPLLCAGDIWILRVGRIISYERSVCYHTTDMSRCSAAPLVCAGSIWRLWVESVISYEPSVCNHTTDSSRFSAAPLPGAEGIWILWVERIWEERIYITLLKYWNRG